jgi:hypothetical protein
MLTVKRRHIVELKHGAAREEKRALVDDEMLDVTGITGARDLPMV